MKLFTRFNRINLSVMVLVFLLSGILYYVLLSNVLVHELDEELEAYRDRIEHYARKNGVLPDLTDNFEDLDISYHKTDKKQKHKYASATRYDREEKKNNRFRELSFSLQANGQWYEIHVAKPVEGTKLVTKTIAMITLLLLLLVMLISILLNRIILRKLWRPFYQTIDQLKSFRLSDKKVPQFAATDTDEFAWMNQSLTEVIASANDEYRALKEFTENASHELQTPLAIIRSKLDLVIQEEGLSEQQSQALDNAYKGIHRLTRLNQSLLLLAKIENQQFAATEPIALKERTEEKLQQFIDFWNSNDIHLSVILQQVVITANPELIDILLNNLFSNAGRHNHSGGDIIITLAPGKLSVSNTGPATPLDRLRLFDRFYKQSASNQSNGLGLSIIRQICDRSGIRIQYNFDGIHHSFILTW